MPIRRAHHVHLDRHLALIVLAGSLLALLVVCDPARAAEEGGGADGPVRKAATLAGFVSYGLMALTVMWGVLTTTGIAKRTVRRQSLYMSHMSLAIGTLAFGSMHAVTYTFQKQESFGWVKVLVPFAGGGEFEVALGIVGLELMAALMATIIIQRRIGYRTWHTLHYALYGAFVLALLHTITTSPEARALGLIGITVGALALAVAAMTAMRFLPATSAIRGRIATVEP